MTTSVPTVIPIGELQLRLARMLDLAVEATQRSGNLIHLDLAVKETRGLYEEIFKPAAHLGRLDWAYVNNLGKALERVEGIVEKARDRIAAEK